MGSLEDFELRIKDLIQQFHLNINISGVALIVTEAHEQLYSASLIVEGSGVVPYPSVEHISLMKSVMQRSPACGYSLHYIQYVSALFKDEKLLRWQAQYTVSADN